MAILLDAQWHPKKNSSIQSVYRTAFGMQPSDKSVKYEHGNVKQLRTVDGNVKSKVFYQQNHIYFQVHKPRNCGLATVQK